MKTLLLCCVLGLNLMSPPANAQIMSIGGILAKAAISTRWHGGAIRRRLPNVRQLLSRR